jgi:hypothetical protein
VFHTILSVNSDYFLKWYQPTDLCNGKALSFLCGMKWILLCYFDEFWLQRVKVVSQENLCIVLFNTPLKCPRFIVYSVCGSEVPDDKLCHIYECGENLLGFLVTEQE